MLPELSNIQITYPFIDTQFSAAQRTFVNSIKYIRLYLYLQQVSSVAVTAFSSSTIQISIAYNGTVNKIYADMEGNITDPSGNLVDIKNSFILFSNPISVSSSSCVLQLLPQVIHLIKSGLVLRIASLQPIRSQAQVRDLSSPSPYWKQFGNGDQINFQKGYNFQPSINNDTAQLWGAQNTGLGLPKACEVRKLIAQGQSDSYYSDSNYYGVRAVNGITGDLSLGTSSGLYLQTTLSNSTLRLSITQTEEQDDTSQ